MPPWDIVGRIVFSLCPFPDESTDLYQTWCPIGPAVWQLSQTWICDPLKAPEIPPGVLRGDLYLAYVHSPTNPQTCTKFGANRSSRLTASQDFWICDLLKAPKMPPWAMVGRIVFSLCPFPDESIDLYQTWCQSVLAVWQLSQTWICDPLNPPKCPLKYWGANCIDLCPFPYEFADVYQIWCQSVQPFDCFPRLLNLWPKSPRNAPLGIEGRLVFSLCPFPDESADVYQIRCQSVQPFDRFPRLLNLWPPKSPEMPPGVLRDDLNLAYVHSQTNPQTWTKVGAYRSSRLTASPDFWMFDPLKPHQVPPCASRGNLFGVYPFPDESADVNQSWCQWVQPFDSFPRLLNVWPPKTQPSAPLCLEGQFVWRISIPRWIRRREPHLVPMGPAVWQLPKYPRVILTASQDECLTP